MRKLKLYLFMACIASMCSFSYCSQDDNQPTKVAKTTSKTSSQSTSSINYAIFDSTMLAAGYSVVPMPNYVTIPQDLSGSHMQVAYQKNGIAEIHIALIWPSEDDPSFPKVTGCSYNWVDLGNNNVYCTPNGGTCNVEITKDEKGEIIKVCMEKCNNLPS